MNELVVRLQTGPLWPGLTLSKILNTTKRSGCQHMGLSTLFDNRQNPLHKWGNQR